nr:MAG TPA: hypothetical protein [Caudoviricetes sp.]
MVNLTRWCATVIVWSHTNRETQTLDSERRCA